MRRTMRRYWGLLALGLLIIPALGVAIPAEPAEAPVRFVATADLARPAIRSPPSFASTRPCLLPVSAATSTAPERGKCTRAATSPLPRPAPCLPPGPAG